MDWARPRIIKGGYLLRSLEVTPEGFWCDPWAHVMPVQWRSGRSVARTVDLATHCPSSHWSKCIVASPRVRHHCRTAWVCQMVEHLLALGLFEHNLGSSGCSRKHQGSPFPLNRRWMTWASTINRRRSKLSLSVSICSWGCKVDRPQHSGSGRPLTGTGAPGFGNQRRILQVRQFGPPPAPWRSPLHAWVHSWS